MALLVLDYGMHNENAIPILWCAVHKLNGAVVLHQVGLVSHFPLQEGATPDAHLVPYMYEAFVALLHV